MTHKKLSTTTDIPSSALRRAHKDYIEKAVSSIENVDISLRDITGCTLTIDKNKISEAKEIIKKFRRDPVCD